MAVRRSSRTICVQRQREDRKYWQKKIQENKSEDLSFLINSWGFQYYWFKPPYYHKQHYNMITDYLKRGFLIYCIDDTLRSNTRTLEEREKYLEKKLLEPMESGIFIEFAFVEEKYRKKHVLTKMFRKLIRLYPKKVISLSSMESAISVWLKLGFVHDPFWSDETSRLVRFPGKKGGIY